MKSAPFIITAALAATVTSSPLPPNFEARQAANPDLYIITPLSSGTHIESTMPLVELKGKHRPISQPNEIRVVKPLVVENFTQPGVTKPSGNNRKGFTRQGERKGATHQHSERRYPDSAAQKEKDSLPPMSTERLEPQSRKKMSRWVKYTVVSLVSGAVMALGIGAAWYERHQPGWESNESWANKN